MPFHICSIALALFAFVAPLSSYAAASNSDMLKWDAKTERDFASLLCGDGEYFRECFSVSRQTCEQTLKSEARACDIGLSAAKRKTLKSEVQLFAEIGLCAGLRIETKWRDRKANSSKCDHKENWQ